jgi:K+-transporting ATPase KdpF subunit
MESRFDAERDARSEADMSVGDVIAGLVAVVLLIYLIYALLRPERF